MAWLRKSAMPMAPPDGQSEGPADHVVGASPFHLLVGGDFRHRQGSWYGDEVAQDYDRHGPQQSHMCHGETKPQKQDGTQNRGDRRHEYGKRSQSLLLHGVKIGTCPFVSVPIGLMHEHPIADRRDHPCPNVPAHDRHIKSPPARSAPFPAPRHLPAPSWLRSPGMSSCPTCDPALA